MDKQEITSEKVNKIIGAKVRNLRINQKINQEELAVILGIDRVSISNVERGTHGMPTHRIIYLCMHFGITPNDIMPTKEELDGSAFIPNLKNKRTVDKLLEKIKISEARIEKLKNSINEQTK